SERGGVGGKGDAAGRGAAGDRRGEGNAGAKVGRIDRRTQCRRRWRGGRRPCLDLSDTRPGVERAGDVDANAIGGIGGERHRALDQIVATDRAQDYPRSAIPALDGEIDQPVETEGHRVGGLDWVLVVVLYR